MPIEPLAKIGRLWYDRIISERVQQRFPEKRNLKFMVDKGEHLFYHSFRTDVLI